MTRGPVGRGLWTRSPTVAGASASVGQVPSEGALGVDVGRVPVVADAPTSQVDQLERLIQQQIKLKALAGPR